MGYYSFGTSVILLACVGLYDVVQKSHTILRNFPLIGHFRYLFEMIRPEISQYFIESDTDGKPISREMRSIVYQRSKQALDTLPFGTKRDVYKESYEWICHSLFPKEVEKNHLRTIVGEQRCKQSYDINVFNISAMSYGALSSNAIEALNWAAKEGHFAHNTGEGGVSPYHLKHGGDLIWQIGTGYFGCRHEDGTFSKDKFRAQSTHPHIKMIELKLSQGAKPGHGGILPAQKISKEIAQIRGVPQNKDIVSPPGHSAFGNYVEMLDFIDLLREESDSKPVGIKLCVGRLDELIELFFTMKQEDRYPDFISIDGGEGGTGAAPLEFSNSVGFPLWDALMVTNGLLNGFEIRDKLKINVTGKLITGFDLVKAFCLGADFCSSARGMMLALGCIQALRCNSNECPTGVATTNPALADGLYVDDKAERVRCFHEETLQSCAEIIGTVGAEGISDLSPEMILRRPSDDEIESYARRYPSPPTESFVDKAHALHYVQTFFSDTKGKDPRNEVIRVTQ